MVTDNFFAHIIMNNHRSSADVMDTRSATAIATEKMCVVLKEKQQEAVEAYMKGNDTFVSLPTGYGKSMILRPPSICF